MNGVVYLAGTTWESVAGTDRHLTSAMAERGPVLYVDPPVPVVRFLPRQLGGRRGITRPGLTQVAPGVHRLRVLGPPYLTRPNIFPITTWIQEQAARRAVRRVGMSVDLVIVASPWNTFPYGMGGQRLLYMTDDWEQGALLLGLSVDFVTGRLEHNLAQADLAAGVSEALVSRMHRSASAASVFMLPNGCGPGVAEPRSGQDRPMDLPPGRHVGVVGQLNERIDVGVLEVIAEAGLSLVLIGPRTEVDSEQTARFDRLFAADNVHWLGRKDPADLPAYLAALEVGVTPYVDNAFNRASFPLKTLEYLAAGLPAVSSDVPAVRWLDTPHIRIATSPEEFLAEVSGLMERADDPAGRSARIAFAAGHSWRTRVDLLETMLGPGVR